MDNINCSRETLGFETETENWVVSVSVLRLETSLLKAESHSYSSRPRTKSLDFSLEMSPEWKNLSNGLNSIITGQFPCDRDAHIAMLFSS